MVVYVDILRPACSFVLHLFYYGQQPVYLLLGLIGMTLGVCCQLMRLLYKLPLLGNLVQGLIQCRGVVYMVGISRNLCVVVPVCRLAN